ncbi:unnamed protein product [Linum tenue]|uniref:UspA domain-containing protein n=1 Tax=Linum tenue TaxID=586396 RepID=A0AAV0S2G1_9ROSI|nr:unnamed protein product [Linum tenue]CAI0626608.1 unnamed protein product [Linum tenue]
MADSGRRIGVAVDFSPCSIKALKWAIDNLARDALIPLVEVSDPATMSKYGVKPDPETLDVLNTAARQKKVNRTFPLFVKHRFDSDSGRVAR